MQAAVGSVSEPSDAADVGGPAATLVRRAAIHRALGEPHRLAIVDALRLSDRAPSTLARLTGLGSNLVAFHLDVLERAGVVTRLPSEGDRRRRYVRLHPDALSALLPPARVHADDVLFVCTRNSARSQLAAALWERRTGRPARSAGRDPADRVHPLALQVAHEHGLDLTDATPTGYDEAAPPDLLVSVCDRAHEAGAPFDVPKLHWSVPDPVGGSRAAVDAALRELAVRVETLASSLADVGTPVTT